MNSLRHRTLSLVLGLLIAGTLTITSYNYYDSSHEVAEIYDAQLAQNARLLMGIVHAPLPDEQKTALYKAFNEELNKAGAHRIGHPYERKMAFEVWNLQGLSLVRSASAPTFDHPPATAGFSRLDSAGQGWHGFLLPDEKNSMQVWVGERDDVREDLVNRIVRHTLIPQFIGIVLLAVLIWFAVGWGLQPLQNMARVIRARHAESLEPLQLMPLPRELEPMQAALNRLLSQIEHLLQRERRFIGDAAHEMRTPLAVLRIHVQNALEAQTPEQRNEALQFLLGGVDRLTRVVNQLLVMARVDPQVARANWQRIDIESVVRQTLAELTPWILSKDLELSLEVVQGSYWASGDAEAIGIALQNLVTNAANFSTPGSEIEVQLRESEQGGFVLSVRDHGPGIDEQKIERLFERFYSRNNPDGAGLGLSIVEMIAKRLGGTIELENQQPNGLLASLSIPRHDD